MSWRMLDLFSGIGGFSLAAQWCWGDELEIVAFCEIDKFCQKVLRKHWPNVQIIGNIRDVKKTLSNTIDLLTGGFPCQPFSCAGKRKGKEDNCFLWPEMFRVIKDVKPRYVVAENVPGIIGMALDDCLSDLENEGYWNYIDHKGKGRIAPLIIPACAVNAPHRRDRVWIVAHNDNSLYLSHQGKVRSGRNSSQLCRENLANTEGHAERPGFGEEESREIRRRRSGNSCEDESDTNKSGLSSQREQRRVSKKKREAWPGIKRRSVLGGKWVATERPIESNVGRNFDGLPAGLDGYFWTDGWEEDVPRIARGVKERVNRLKSLGNAIVPQVAYQIMKAIKEVEKEQP